MTVVTESEYWTEQRAAHYLGLAAITLKTWRLQKRKPIAAPYKFGRRIMYRRTDVEAYAAARTTAVQP